MLGMFRRGEVRAVVTSHVPEGGADVPDASVVVVISGTGSPREFIRRLGRVLRPKEGKRAVLYELVTRGTREVYVPGRRGAGLGGAPPLALEEYLGHLLEAVRVEHPNPLRRGGVDLNPDVDAPQDPRVL